MSSLEGVSRSSIGLDPGALLSQLRRSALIDELATRLVVPGLVARFGAPPARRWQQDAAALAATLGDQPLPEAITALAALNPGGRKFRTVCRDVILPAVLAMRRRFDPDAFDQSERLARLWHLRMCLLSLDDAGPEGRSAMLNTALTLSGATDMPSVEHEVARRFFGRAGWEMSDCCCHATEQACDSAHDRRFDVAWISIEPGMGAAAIRSTARSLRRASRNARILVIGGGAVGGHPADAAELDLDGYTSSAVEAAAFAEVALRQQHHPSRRAD